MHLRRHFLEIKRVFFPRWDRGNRWRFSTRSRRRVYGHCDSERQVIEIIIQHADPDERDKLFVHEICHAVSNGSHGKVWQRRMEKAAKRAEEIGRPRLGQLLCQEITNYQEATEGREEAYQTIRDWIEVEPGLTLAQVKRSLADLHGLLVSEVCKVLRRTEEVFQQARREALKYRALKEAVWRRGRHQKNPLTGGC